MPEEIKEVKKDEDWMQKKWRPAMGWMYMVVCMMDMVVFPVLWSLVQVLTKQPVSQWNPLTLQGAGLFHLAMGAVLGIAAFGRTQEKLNGANNGGAAVPAPAPSSFSAPPAPSFGAQPLGGNSASSFGGGFGSTPSAPAVTAGFGGKAAPPAQDFPPI